MPRQHFRDSQFLSGWGKELILRDWMEFLPALKEDEPLQKIYRTFTERLYKHVTLHCSFIAHYDRHGFISSYFEDPEDTPNFLQQFDKDKGYVSWEYGMTCWLTGEYEDINRAMCDAFEAEKAPIYATLKKRTLAKKRGQIAKLEHDLRKLEKGIE